METGAELKFFFNLSHLNDITQIDANLRKLVEGFTIHSENRK